MNRAYLGWSGLRSPLITVITHGVPAAGGSWLVARSSSSSSIFPALQVLFLDGPVLSKSASPAFPHLERPLFLFPLTTSNPDSLEFSPSFLRHSLSFVGTWPTHSLPTGLSRLVVQPCLDPSREVPHLGVHTVSSVFDATSPISIAR